jgi:hypothetical protein
LVLLSALGKYLRERADRNLRTDVANGMIVECWVSTPHTLVLKVHLFKAKCLAAASELLLDNSPLPELKSVPIRLLVLGVNIVEMVPRFVVLGMMRHEFTIL